MNSWRLENGEKIIAQIGNIKELENVLNSIINCGKKNVIYFLIHPNGQFMQFGIANKFGFLNFHNSSDTPPYYSSLSDNKIAINEYVDFYICDNYTEIPLKNCISIDKLLATIKEFFITERLPKSIEWEED